MAALDTNVLVRLLVEDDAAQLAAARRLVRRSVELLFQFERAVEVALALYGRGAADFSHCLLSALAAASDEQPLWTFDRNAAKVDGARLLTV